VIEKLISDQSPVPEKSTGGLEIDAQSSFIDASFSVPYRHRVWFCDSVFDFNQQGSPILAACFADNDPNHDSDQDSDKGTLANTVIDPAKVQVWVDSSVGQHQPQFVADFESWFDSQAALRMTRPAEIISGGEVCKNDPAEIQRLLAAINDDQLDRRSYIVVIGGGAVLDVVGYAAAVAHRGIRLVRFPSTTLAQADSGVGVKNAVNQFNKKNWQGTFAVPWAVVNDYSLLQSLSQSTFVSGFAEAVKVALLKSPAFFDQLCVDADAIGRREKDMAATAIEQSASLHLRHITEGGDPFELLEARPLDFGHWSAHKIESISRYSVSHGDAVSIGLALDVLYSANQLGLPRDQAGRVIDCLRRLGLPIWDPILSTHRDVLLLGLEEFRQHLGGQLTVTMLQEVGKPVNVHSVDHAAMSDAIDTLREISLQTDSD
jgi:3-dehydroquinate synthase